MSLPTADDLFRPTEPAVRAVPDQQEQDQSGQESPVRRRPSGRVRHDEKMTVYITSSELLHLEQARLALRAQHGIVVDRGRLVREALTLVLEEFEAHGDESALVRRLTEE